MSTNVSEVSDLSKVSEVSAERIWGVPKNAWLALGMVVTVFVGNRYNVAPLAWVASGLGPAPAAEESRAAATSIIVPQALHLALSLLKVSGILSRATPFWH